jgi:hypothetical protein
MVDDVDWDAFTCYVSTWLFGKYALSSTANCVQISKVIRPCFRKVPWSRIYASRNFVGVHPYVCLFA